MLLIWRMNGFWGDRMKIKDSKKFSELSQQKKIYVIALMLVLVIGVLYMVFNIRDIMSADYVFTDSITGESCTEHYEYGKLVTPECTEMRARIEATNAAFINENHGNFDIDFE